jgi:uncharacterized protein
MMPSTELRVPVDEAELAVTYTPAGETVVVAVHGASAGTRDFHLYEHLHATLPDVGVGVATFDRRGEGASSGDRSVGQIDLQARDALAVVEALGVDHVGLWGFSQGGWVAPLAAGMSSQIEFLVLIASTGVTPADQMRYAAAEQLRRAGYGRDVIEQAELLRERYEAWVHRPESALGAQLRADLAAASQEPWWQLVFLDASLPDTEGRAEWIAEMDLDPIPIFAATRVPTLLFYGEEDEWSPVGPSVAAWRRARANAVEVVVIPGASHDLMVGGQLAPSYQERLLEWLRART